MAACSSVQPSVGQYAIVTGQGQFSNQQVEDVVAPGGHIKVQNGWQAWYLPAQFRNFVTAPSNADRTTPQAVLTGSGKNGEPGMPVQAWTYVGFELNPAIENQNMKFAKAFFPFCLKYACASQDAQTDTSNTTDLRSSNPGWLNMLDEVFPHAIDNATQTAAKGYGPDLWTNKGEYTSLGDSISASLNAELQKMDNSPSGMPYFCGPGSTTHKCTPLTVIVNNVTPTDPDVISSYNQQISSRYQEQAGASRLAAARAVYGGDANWFLGMLDLIKACEAQRVSCNIYAGNAPFHP